jgi:hypothetical protein
MKLSNLWSLAAIGTLSLGLTGCGAVASFNSLKAQEEMTKSLAAYKACLSANSTSPNMCATLQAAYEADLSAYKAGRGNVVVVE